MSFTSKNVLQPNLTQFLFENLEISEHDCCGSLNFKKHTLYSKFKAAFGTGSRFVSDSVPEITIHTFAEEVIPFRLGTITTW